MKTKLLLSGVAAYSLFCFKCTVLVITGITWTDTANCSSEAAMPLNIWLLVYSILGLLATIVWIVVWWADFREGDDEDYDCFPNTNQTFFGASIGLPYLVLSLVFHILGWVVLFGESVRADCLLNGTSTTELSWNFGFANVIIFYPYSAIFIALYAKLAWICAD